MSIKLVKDTIDFDDITKLIEWLKTNPRLTKGKLTTEFEKKWSEWLGVKYSVFVNSGSSANLAAIYSLLLSGKLKNNKIVVPGSLR
jgi:CDP-6-deoxy-D-xylo-4-hexulose-3-dehydrase